MKKYIITLIAVLWAIGWTITGNKVSAESDICYDTEIVIEEVTKTGVREVEKSKIVEIPGSDEVNHQEFQHKRIEPAIPEIKEYRWYRSYTGPKVIHGFSWDGSKWVSTPGVNGAVPDSLNPPSNLVSGQTGTFTGGNKPYQLPSNPRTITWSYGSGGSEWWPSEDGWATSLNGAPQGAWGNPLFTQIRPGTGIDAKAYFYLPGGDESEDLTETNWTVDVVDSQIWTQIAERTVVDQDAVLPSTETVYWTEEEEYEYTEEVETEVQVEIDCEIVPTTTVVEPPTTTVTPKPPETTPEVPTTTVVVETTVPTVPVVPENPVKELPSTGTGVTVILTVGIIAIFIGGGVLFSSKIGKKV